MKNNSFEKTERAKHRKKQMKKIKIPKLIFIKIKTQLLWTIRLKVIRSQCEANLHQIYDTNRKNS